MNNFSEVLIDLFVGVVLCRTTSWTLVLVLMMSCCGVALMIGQCEYLNLMNNFIEVLMDLFVGTLLLQHRGLILVIEVVMLWLGAHYRAVRRSE